MLSCFSRSVSLLTLSSLIFSVSNSQVCARWAEFNEADVEGLNSKRVIIVQKDGTLTDETEVQFKIINEAGRAFATQIFTYDTTLCRLDVIKAVTYNDGVEVVVPKDKIEDKPLASDHSGLKKEHQVLIPLEQVVVGSIIHLKIKTNHFHSHFEEYFAQYLTFKNMLWQTKEVIIQSELPLLIKVNDPRNSLEVNSKWEDSKHTLHVKLRKPIFEKLVGESELSFGEPHNYTSVSVSTEKDYERLGKLEAKLFQPILSSTLPEPLENIRKVASEINMGK